MSYNEFLNENPPKDFAPFLKAGYINSFPLEIEVSSVDKQTLPQTGPSLVARIRITEQLLRKLDKSYIAKLEKVEAKDIGLPLNKTNADILAKIFGDNFHAWHGNLKLIAVDQRNPNTDQLVKGLQFLIPPHVKPEGN